MVGQKMSQHPRLRYVVNIKGKYDDYEGEGGSKMPKIEITSFVNGP